MNTLYIVHCIDAEGPMYESIDATFSRLYDVYGFRIDASLSNLKKLQNGQIDLNGQESAVATFLSSELLEYNDSWTKIDSMLQDALSPAYRNKVLDDFGSGWVYSWHCMDHVSLNSNPRRKDIGYGNIFTHYKNILKSTNSIKDEINWHFHPLSVDRNPLSFAHSYVNNYDILLGILSRRVIDHEWFPTVNRPGFHSERPDSHLFLEQWIPFDYANQYYEENENQLDLAYGRVGDWRRAPSSWCGYNPDIYDYQSEGSCRRTIFRCLNLGTRHKNLNLSHFHQAFSEARKTGSAILSFVDHDFRDIRKDVDYFRQMLETVRSEYKDVKIRFTGAESAAINHLGLQEENKLSLSVKLNKNKLKINVEAGSIFGPQPFLCFKTFEGKYYHDNLDFGLDKKSWTYIFDNQNIPINNIQKIGVASAGLYGGFYVKTLVPSYE